MTPSAEVQVSSAPPSGCAARGLLRWVSCSNPFYVCSAGLFLVGLWSSFQAQSGEIHTWALMGGLGGYTLLLALTAFLLVRFAKDWEDLRTVLLLVVLMFLATSVTFDEMLAITPARGFACYLVGLAFTVLVSEGLLRGIRLKLPSLFRVPYYLVLALFFLYPLALSPFVNQPHSEELLWGLFGFSSVAGLIALTLLPAIRRGPAYVAGNGSPWGWPVYPWMLFGLLALAVPARAFLLCYSMHLLSAVDRGRVIFGPYFLIPFGLAVCVLLVEIGLVSNRRGVLWTGVLAPLALLATALLGHRDDPIFREFLDLFTLRLGGNPLYLTVLALGAFYAYAGLRGVPLATEALSAVLISLAFVGPTSIEVGERDVLQSLPIMAVVALQLTLAWRRRNPWRFLLATAVMAGGLARWVWWLYVIGRQFIAGVDQLLLSMALFMVAVMISLWKAGLLARWMVPLRWRQPVLEGAVEVTAGDPSSEGNPGDPV